MGLVSKDISSVRPANIVDRPNEPAIMAHGSDQKVKSKSPQRLKLNTMLTLVLLSTFLVFTDAATWSCQSCGITANDRRPGGHFYDNARATLISRSFSTHRWQHAYQYMVCDECLETRGLICSGCNQRVPKDKYSNKQWKTVLKAKCKDCCADNAKKTPPNPENPKLKSLEATQARQCGKCGFWKTCGDEGFSNRQ